MKPDVKDEVDLVVEIIEPVDETPGKLVVKLDEAKKELEVKVAELIVMGMKDELVIKSFVESAVPLV